MEPLSDKELDRLLQLWVAPATPRSLHQRLFAVQAPWWQRLLDSFIRRPSFVGRRYPHRKKSSRKV